MPIRIGIGRIRIRKESGSDQYKKSDDKFKKTP